jgi:predicted SAM-dependent methyltransferase
MNFLNIGCGSIFHSEWTNIDLVSNSSIVEACDLRKGLPYSNSYFNVCYSSHLLEHLTQDEAQQLLGECFRVLKSGGIIRVVVPDLEAIARTYLSLLETVETGNQVIKANYDWIMLELYDQVVRSYIGGEMVHYLGNLAINNKEFILSRIGAEAENYWHHEEIAQKSSFLQKFLSKSISWWFQKLRIELAKFLVFLIAGIEAKRALEEGLFRNSGEIHRWMYDRFSLGRLLKQAGFIEIRVCQADDSLIPNFSRYNLDTVDGKVRKPDSLFMEAVKP